MNYDSAEQITLHNIATLLTRCLSFVEVHQPSRNFLVRLDAMSRVHNKKLT